MVLVIKKDGERQTFDPAKIKMGIIKACEKRPVSAQDIDNIVTNVEKMVYNSLDQEITSHDIGEKIMDELKELDQVAYVRFASVYRHFKDLNSFKDELNELLKE
jgi:transcriptional repressor NrdR